MLCSTTAVRAVRRNGQISSRLYSDCAAAGKVSINTAEDKGAADANPLTVVNIMEIDGARMPFAGGRRSVGVHSGLFG